MTDPRDPDHRPDGREAEPLDDRGPSPENWVNDPVKVSLDGPSDTPPPMTPATFVIRKIPALKLLDETRAPDDRPTAREADESFRHGDLRVTLRCDAAGQLFARVEKGARPCVRARVALDAFASPEGEWREVAFGWTDVDGDVALGSIAPHEPPRIAGAGYGLQVIVKA